MENHMTFQHSFTRWLHLHQLPVTLVQVEVALQSLGDSPPSNHDDQVAWFAHLWTLLGQGGYLEYAGTPDLWALPLLGYNPQRGWGVVQSRSAAGKWLVQLADGSCYETADETLTCYRYVPPITSEGTSDTAMGLILRQLKQRLKTFAEVSFASFLLGLLGFVISFYSMQVYDRVIPNQGFHTLWVLTFGVLMAIAFEFSLKIVRSHLLEPAVLSMDVSISRALFERLQSIRMDQRPQRVGSLAAQMQGFESVRGFFSTTTLFLMLDLPLGLLFIFLIATIASWQLAAIPLLFLPLSVLWGFLYRYRLAALSKAAIAINHDKTGMLVEVIEGAETIKGNAAGWRFLGRWSQMIEKSAEQAVQTRHVMDQISYFTAAMQQISYVLLVAMGAWLVTRGELSQGGVVACSILTGRALSPSAQIPGFLVQWSNASASITALESLFKLQKDNHGVERPLVPKSLGGAVVFESVQFSYGPQAPGLNLPLLRILPGEKVGILGPIGAGKSTLLTIAAGLAKPQKGRVLIDGLDISHISIAALGEHIGFMPQTAWMFSGTLRENLLLGQPDLDDELLIDTCKRTGLWGVVSNHPKGLDLKIMEGGKGLSGGQKQLVALTRLLISKPDLWLLDEPTSGMDDGLEAHVVNLLKEVIQVNQTLLLVTHRRSMLDLVDRLVILSPAGIQLDGPRDQVLAHLSGQPPSEQSST